MVVPKIKLGSQGLEVSAQGLGCMGMSSYYGPAQPQEDMIALIHRAVEAGVTFLDTSDIYGPFTNETLLGKALRPMGLGTRFSWLPNLGSISPTVTSRSTAIRPMLGPRVRPAWTALGFIVSISIISIGSILKFPLKSRLVITNYYYFILFIN